MQRKPGVLGINDREDVGADVVEQGTMEAQLFREQRRVVSWVVKPRATPAGLEAADGVQRRRRRGLCCRGDTA